MDFTIPADVLTEDAAIALEEAFEGFSFEVERYGRGEFGTVHYPKEGDGYKEREKDIAGRIAKADVAGKILAQIIKRLVKEGGELEQRWQEEQREISKPDEYHDKLDRELNGG